MRYQETIHIVCAGDDNFALPMAVMLYSLFRNASKACRYKLYIISDGIGPGKKKRLAHVIRNTQREVQVVWKEAINHLQQVKNFVVKERYPRTTYLRLFIPEFVDKGLEKCIYLDGDMLVEYDIADLWNIAMSDNIFLAVQDFLNTKVSSEGAIPHTYQQLGLNPDTPFFNGGMYVVNLARYIENQIAEKACAYLEQFPQYINFADQDALNAAVLGRWGLLDPRWNVQVITINDFGRDTPIPEWQLAAHREDMLRNPFCLHFNGHNKPWNLKGNPVFVSRFLAYLKSSGWFTKFEYMEWYLKTWRKHVRRNFSPFRL
ncbi:MAG: glycosyltransferase family 8 protein [Chitinophagaceae bacterium]|nr:MAG: glycosyltransferase family 8 protein [Chitinophagaceae bacterium]